MKKIMIGDVGIPTRDYAIGGSALLGIRGSGKTYGAKGIAEQLVDQGVPIIVFDAIGVWRHLKVPAARGADGLPVVVAGGHEPDLPLSVSSAPEIVRAAIRENVNLVIDLYDRKLSKADWRRIVQACFRTLLFENKGVRHIFLEEAAEYIPQKVMDGETYAEVEKVARMGGNASLGLTIINQRAQEVNKAVLDLCENLILMRQRGAHAIDALEKWIDKVSPDSAKKIAADMPNMGPGDAWVFAGDAIAPVRTRTAKIRTFHPDRRHPDVTASGTAADTGPFVAALQAALPKIAEEANANDPVKLKARIRDLEAQHRKNGAAAPAVDVSAIEERGYQRGLAAARGAQEALISSLRMSAQSALQQIFEDARPPKVTAPVRSFTPVKTHILTREKPATAEPGTEPPIVRKILDVFHRSYPVSLSFDAAARRAAVSSRSSAYRKYRELIAASDELEESDGKYRSRPEFASSDPIDSRASLNEWIGKLPPAYGNMLRAIHENGPIDKETVAELSGVSKTSSGLGTGLRELQSLQLIAERDGRYEVEEGLQ